MGLKHIGIAVAALLAGSWLVASRAQAPRSDAGQVPRAGNIHVLSPADHDLFLRAFAAAARSDWVNAMALGNQGQDTAARQLLQWRYALDRDSGAKFADVDAALKMATGWPLHNALLVRAEADITPEMTPAQIAQWFGARAPASPIGRVRLGEAMAASGDKARGGALIRQGWGDGSFDDATEAGILAQDGPYLTPDADKSRLDTLVWRDEVSAARRQMA